MATSRAQFSYSNDPVQELVTMRRHFVVVAAILSLGIAGLIFALLFLPGSWLGFGVAFGGGILAFECALVIRKVVARISSIEREKQRVIA